MRVRAGIRTFFVNLHFLFGREVRETTVVEKCWRRVLATLM